MLEVENKIHPIAISPGKKEDIIVTRYKIVTETTKEGILTKRVPQKINVTKKVNETKKLVIGNTMEEKLAKVKQAVENL